VRLTFLGTGTSGGVPMIACTCPVCLSTDAKDKRLRSAVMIEAEGKTLIVDSGPDFRQQMLREKVMRVDGIIYTHSHKDHTGGLDDIRAYNYILKRDMPLYLDAFTEQEIRDQYSYIFSPNPYPGIPRVQIHRIDGDTPFVAEGISVIPIKALHHQMPVLGFRFGDITYITDANYIAPTEIEKIRGTRILVLNALRREAHISHFTLQQAIELIQQIKPERAYLTHISHQLGTYHDVSKELPEGIFLAYDGLKVE
jgi:phosphoribosyl 1,2-cyclic phosphate phosphodiesterase